MDLMMWSVLVLTDSTDLGEISPAGEATLKSIVALVLGQHVHNNQWGVVVDCLVHSECSLVMTLTVKLNEACVRFLANEILRE